LLQRPQWLTDVFVLTSQPLATIKSQFANPALHAPIAHLPDAQVGIALGAAHD
jgi:hypothetical protein